MVLAITACGSPQPDQSSNPDVKQPLFVIKPKLIGSIELGSSIPSLSLPDGLLLVESEQLINIDPEDSENEFARPVYNVMQGDDTLMVVRVGFDYVSGRVFTDDKVESVVIFSPEIRTQDGLGVGMTIEELSDVYPKHLIYFNYLDEWGRAYVETEALPGFRFYLDARIDDLVDVEIYDDAVELTSSNLKPGTTIWMIQGGSYW